MAISRFIDPAEEAIFDPTEDIEDHIIDRYIVEEEDMETDEEVIERPQWTPAEALKASQILREFEESLDNGDREPIDLVTCWEKDAKAHILRRATQTSITSYFNHVD